MGSPVSTTLYLSGSSRSGVVGEAPAVSRATTAMPSIAATSPTGEERVAQTGSAVTRPTASASGTVTTPTRWGQPAAAQASSHDRIAVSAGTSLMKGLLSGAAGLGE